MKIKLMITLLLTCATSTAFAASTTYSCGLPTGSHGESLDGGPAYEVSVSNEVILKELVGADEGKPLRTQVIGKMNKKDVASSQFQEYELGNVTFSIARIFDTIWRESYGLSILVDGNVYTSTCTPVTVTQ
jgi:hypothetical protein